MMLDGTLRVLQTADPVAGADPAALTCPLNKRWRVVSARAQLVTGATAATRRAVFTVKDKNAVILAEFAAGDSQVASLTRDYTWAQAGADYANRDGKILGLIGEGPIVPGGGSVEIDTVALQATDDWGILTVMVFELEGGV